MMDATKTYSNIAVTPVVNPPTQLINSTLLTEIVLIIGVATGMITIMTSLNKGQEEKINRLMHKIDELDARLDSVNTNFGNLSEKYATKTELIASERRIEGYFNRMDGKFDAVILGCKINPNSQNSH